MSHTSLALGGPGRVGGAVPGAGGRPGPVPVGRRRALVLAAMALVSAPTVAVALVAGATGSRAGFGAGPGEASGPALAVVALAAAGVVVAIGSGAAIGTQVARRRGRTADRAPAEQAPVEQAPAAQAASQGDVRGGLVTALAALRPGVEATGGPAPDELEEGPNAALVDELVEAARASVESRRADHRGWADVLEQLGWTGYNVAARQLRLLDRLQAELLGPPTSSAAGPSSGSSIGPALAELRQLAVEQQRRARSALVLGGGPTPGLGTAPSHRPAPWPLAEVVRLAGAGLNQPDRLAVGRIAAVEVRPALAADLVHVLAILFDNALRYSPADQPVDVAAAALTTVGPAGGTGAGLRITDRGIGFPPAGRALAAGGRGLGLQVVHRLAARHGFTVDVQPRPDPPGTTVLVVLPPALRVPPEPVALPAPS